MSRGFFRSTAIVGITTLLSRITGLVRDVVQAVMIPAVYLEVYVLANQIPNLLRRLFAEGAFSQAFVPVVAEYKANRSKDDVRELVDSVSGTLGAFLAIVFVLGVIAAPVIVAICAPGFTTKEVGQYGLAVEMLRWTFPYLLFVSLTALAGGVLNSYQQLRLAGIHVGGAERRADRVRGLCIAVLRAAGHGARRRCVRRRCDSAGHSGAGVDQARRDSSPALELAARGGEAHRAG